MLIKNKIKISIKQQTAKSVNNIEIKTSHLKPGQTEKLQNLCNQFSELFSEPDEKLTYTTAVKAEIRTTTEDSVYSRYYPYPMSLKDEVEKQITKLLDDGIIKPSRSPYNSPIWIVPKKTDATGTKKYRLVIDYRKLNSVTIPDRYPIPDPAVVLSQLGQNKFFTVLDLKSGFHQIPLIESDMAKTAFSVNNGKYEFTRLPFGLKNAPSIFQRALDDILREHIGKICLIYIDDIIIFGKNEDSHLKNIETIFKTLHKANMKIQIDKCEFLKTEVEFLGFLVSKDGLKTTETKVKTILDFPPPQTLKELRSFLGLSGFYRCFIKDYAKLAKPLSVLLRGEEGRMSKKISSKIKITLNSDAIDAFNKLKNTLVSNDVMLQYPDFEKEFHLTTDASDYAIGAVLEQDRKPISFISRVLTRREEHYATNEKELLAIVWALKTFRNYLYGTSTVKIYTDHQPLTYALSNRNTNYKLKRWKSILEEYNYEIKYKPGSTNIVADALSRPPQQINSLTATLHSDESSAQTLVAYTDAPVNAFKNQIFISTGNISSYQFQIIFPTYHRHTIIEKDLTEASLTAILKKYLNPSVINCIKTEDSILGKIQTIYQVHFTRYKVLYTRKFVKDILNESEQETEIIKEHNRAHRNPTENKAQLLEKCYFPQMNAKIKRITKQCKICQENKYERHPVKTILKATPIPTHPGHIVHIDLYFTNNKIVLTAIDKFSKYAQAKIVPSRASEDIKTPLRNLLTMFGIPEKIVIDNEKSLSSASITFMIQNQYGIEIFKTPPYKSSINGQIERFHSTLSEVLRCTKAENTHTDFEDLLNRALFKYNYSIHSATKRKPVEVFFGRTVGPNPIELQSEENIRNIKNKQEKDLEFHNKNRTDFRTFSTDDVIYVKINKRLGNKLTPRYKKQIVQEDKGNTILTKSGLTVHKDFIKK